MLQGVGYYDLGVYPQLEGQLLDDVGAQGRQCRPQRPYIGGFKECIDNDCNTDENLADVLARRRPQRHRRPVHRLHDEDKAGTTRFTVGVNNVTDQRPPLIYIGFAGDSDASTYDYMGRYFYARLSQLFCNQGDGASPESSATRSTAGSPG